MKPPANVTLTPTLEALHYVMFGKAKSGEQLKAAFEDGDNVAAVSQSAPTLRGVGGGQIAGRRGGRAALRR